MIILKNGADSIPTLAPKDVLRWLLIGKRLTYLKSLKLMFRFEDCMEASWKLFGSLWGSRENIFEREVTFQILPSHWILAFLLVAQARKYPGVHNSTKIKIYDFIFFFFTSHTFKFNFIWQLGFRQVLISVEPGHPAPVFSSENLG